MFFAGEPTIALLTPIGRAALPFAIVVVAALVIAVVVLYRRKRFVGFDYDEAANFVWSHLSREQRQRLALGHVVEIIEAEKSFGSSEDDYVEARLVAHLRQRAQDVGADVGEADIQDVLRYQYDYACRKGLLI